MFYYKLCVYVLQTLYNRFHFFSDINDIRKKSEIDYHLTCLSVGTILIRESENFVRLFLHNFCDSHQFYSFFNQFEQIRYMSFCLQ